MSKPNPPTPPAHPLPLGDYIKRIADAVGIPQCGGCEVRQKKANDLGQKIADKIKGKPSR